MKIVEDALFNTLGSRSDISEDISVRYKLDPSLITELYRIAKRNKIGLLFLQSLLGAGFHFEKSNKNMSSELERERTAYSHIQETMLRAAEVLNATNCHYAFVKSNYPFPVVPNDVDALVFGGREEYMRVCKNMEENGFKVLERAQLECCFHDSLKGIHLQKHIKDPFDVDLYREVGAGHVIYMKKRRLWPYVHKIQLNGVQIPELDLPLEIALSIFHSIFPERMFTLLLYFHIIYALRRMSKSEINLFINVCYEHKMNKAALIVLSFVEQVQQLCCPSDDSSISNVRESFGPITKVKLDNLPFLYPSHTIMEVFWAKKSDFTFARSFATQAISMLRPNYAKYVINVIRDRSRRETY